MVRQTLVKAGREFTRSPRVFPVVHEIRRLGAVAIIFVLGRGLTLWVRGLEHGLKGLGIWVAHL